MKKLLLILLLILIGCSETISSHQLDIKDGKFYYENKLFSGKVSGDFNGKINDGLFDGYVKERNLKTESYLGITLYDTDTEIGLEGEYKKGLKEGWWKFFSIYTDKTNISTGVVTSDYTYLKWEVFYENNKPIKYKELIRGYNFTYHPDKYEEGFCSSELFEVWYPYSWTEYDENTEEYLEKNTRFTYFECKKSGSYKSFDTCYSSDNCKDDRYLFEEGFYELSKNRVVWGDKIITESFKNGNFKRYYKSGELKVEDNYLNGEEKGPYKIYYKDGKVREEGTHL